MDPEGQEHGDEPDPEYGAEGQGVAGPARIANCELQATIRSDRQADFIESDIERRQPVDRAKLQRIGGLTRDHVARSHRSTAKQAALDSPHKSGDERLRPRADGF